MGKTYYQKYRPAIDAYLKTHNLYSDYVVGFGWTKEYGQLSVFDIPEDFDYKAGLKNDNNEYTKPVLIARVNSDGDVIVLETEYTHKYLKKIPKTA